MSEHAQTTGPWRTDPEFDHELVLGPDGIAVADCSIFSPLEGGRITTPERSQANARLIAAAPDMLKALKSALARLDNGYRLSLEEQRAAAERLHAAIAKATGATP